MSSSPYGSKSTEIVILVLITYLLSVSFLYHWLADYQNEWIPYGAFLPFIHDYSLKYKLIASISFFLPTLFLLPLIVKKKKNIYGEARFSNYRDIKKGGLFGNSGVVLGRFGGVGRWGGRLLINGKESLESIIVVQPTGIGKTTGIMMPTMAHYPGSVIVTDIGGGLGRDTASYRRRFSNVFIFRLDGKNTHRINLLDYVRDGRDRKSDCDELAGIYIGNDDQLSNSQQKDDFWTNAATNLMSGLIEVVCCLQSVTYDLSRENEKFSELPRTMASVWRLLNPDSEFILHDTGEVLHPQGDVDTQSLFMNDILDIVDGVIDQKTSLFLRRFFSIHLRQRQGVTETVLRVLDLWMNENVDYATSSSDVDLRSLRERPSTIYLQISTKDYSRYAPIVRAIFAYIFNMIMRELPSKDERFSVLFGLDEFANLGRIPNIASSITQVRKYNAHFICLVQSLNQLPLVYGKDGASVLLSAFKQQVFSVCNDPETAKYIVGKGFSLTSDSESMSKNPFETVIDSRISTGNTAEKLIKDYEVYTMRKDQILIFSEGMFPIKAKLIKSYLIKHYKKIIDYSNNNVLDVPKITPLDSSGFNVLKLFVRLSKKGAIVSSESLLSNYIQESKNEIDLLKLLKD